MNTLGHFRARIFALLACSLAQALALALATTPVLANDSVLRVSAELPVKEVHNVQQKINESYDCDALLAQINPLWSTCYLDASQPKTGAGVWMIALQQIHWSVQTARANNTYALVAGIDTDL